jgi:glutamate racemase
VIYKTKGTDMKQKEIKRIGIFDSGAGGLTVLKELRKHIKGVNFYYLGDTARLPYGSKSSETIIQYTKQNVNFLLSKKIDLLIIACNTASAYSYEYLKSYVSIPVLDVINPGSQKAVLLTKNKKIGIIGTRATVNSKAYQNTIASIDSSVLTFANPAPLLVPLVEEGMVEGEIPTVLAKNYIAPLVEQNIDTLILGCTHYPLLKKTIENIIPFVNLVDSAKAIRETLQKEYVFNNMKGKTEIFVTDYPENFAILSERFLEGNFDKIEHIDLNKLWRKKDGKK